MSYWGSEFVPFDGSRSVAAVPAQDALIAFVVGLLVVAATWMTIAFVGPPPEEQPCEASASAVAGDAQGEADEDVNGGCRERQDR